MEKLNIADNGQWTLNKSWGEADYETTTHGHSPFKDEASASKAKIDLVRATKDDKDFSYKSMPNLKTGKDELHMLLHRGMSTDHPGESLHPTGEGKGMDGEMHTQNLIGWDHDKGTVSTKSNTIHSTHLGEADMYAEEGWTGKRLSFWVPVSSVHGSGKQIIEHLTPDKKVNYNTHAHLIVAPGEYKLHDHKDYNFEPKTTPTT